VFSIKVKLKINLAMQTLKNKGLIAISFIYHFKVSSNCIGAKAFYWQNDINKVESLMGSAVLKGCCCCLLQQQLLLLY
jgi:hypothetical protein